MKGSNLYLLEQMEFELKDCQAFYELFKKHTVAANHLYYYGLVNYHLGRVSVFGAMLKIPKRPAEFKRFCDAVELWYSLARDIHYRYAEQPPQ